jgi:hypothetical protein
MMKRFVLQLFLFLASLAVPFLIVGRCDNADVDTSQNENIARLKCKSRFDSLDFLFIGNSYTYSGIDPGLFDSLMIRTFNFGIATAGPSFYELMIQDYLAQVKQKPKVICLLVSPTSFSSKADNFVAYPIHRYLSRSYANEWLVIRLCQPGIYPDLAIKSFKKGFSNLTEIGFSKPHADVASCDLKRKGFVQSDSIVNERTIRTTRHLYSDLGKSPFDDKKAEQLLAIGDQLEKDGCRVIYYSLPVNHLTDYFSTDFLKDYNDFLNRLNSHAKLITIDLPAEPGFYRNIDHLNSFGARIVTKKLIGELMREAPAK